MGLFGTRIFLFHGRIGMGTFIFWHMDILAKYIHLLKCLGAKVSCAEMSMSHKIPSAKTVLYQNVHKCQNVCAKMSILLCKVPKYPCADMFRCQNISVPNSPCVKMFMETKCPYASMASGPKHTHVEMSLLWNVHAEMSLVTMLGAEMVESRTYGPLHLEVSSHRAIPLSSQDCFSWLIIKNVVKLTRLKIQTQSVIWICTVKQ